MSEVAKIETPQPPAMPSEGAVILSMIDKLIARPDVPVEKLEQMFELHRKVQAEASRRDYLSAFSRLQADLPAVARKGTGHNNKKYARFEDVIEAIRAPLSKHGFSLSFRTNHEGNVVRITGVLGHESGHQETTDLPLPADASGSKNAVQSWGSSISYGKRYVALTLLGIATDDDDDGKKAGETGFISDEQQAELRRMLEATETDISKFLEFVNADNMAEIPARDFQRVRGLLAKKAQKGTRNG